MEKSPLVDRPSGSNRFLTALADAGENGLTSAEAAAILQQK